MALIDDVHEKVNRIYAQRKGLPGSLAVRSDQIMALMEVLVEMLEGHDERLKALEGIQADPGPLPWPARD